MRNREIIEYLIYPKFFNAHSVLYKGTYCVSFKVYNITKNKTMTYAYPFPLRQQGVYSNHELKEDPTTHADGNFSYLTHKFEIVYEEEEKKKIESQCIFRLQFELCKTYNIFLEIKLLRKISSQRLQEEMGMCVRKMYDTKYEVINEQELEIKQSSFSSYERVYFRASEFYSSVDLYLCNFNYGHKVYRSKMQISNFFANTDLYLHNAVAKMRERSEPKEGKTRREDTSHYKVQLLKDHQCGIPSYYFQLLKMIEEYRRLLKEYDQLFNSVARENEKSITELPSSNLCDLQYIKIKDPKVSMKTLQAHYQVATPEEILSLIFQEKELVRKNIRQLRENFCLLLIYQPQKHFCDAIRQSIEQNDCLQESLFVRYVEDLMKLSDRAQSQARAEAIQEYTRDRSVWNKKLNSNPLFFIQGRTCSPEQKSRQKHSTLTVFVHGYQGNSFDFQKAKNYLRKSNRNTHILIIESITSDMNQSIEHLGQQAANELIKYLEYAIFNFTLINFIGFSLGGIIARAAFVYLRKYWDRFNLFITFSSPHLGISECENSLVNLGVWYLIKVDKVKNLKELNFQSVSFNESTLMKLSNCEALAQFKKVVLVCSKNDGFVPYYSTVLDERKCERTEIKDLCRNLTSRMKEIERVELCFEIENSGTLDKLTGRRGHIQFLDNDYFLELFFGLYGPAL